jgi:hypothetical protein
MEKLSNLSLRFEEKNRSFVKLTLTFLLQRIYLPQEYKSLQKEHDVALLELETPIRFNKKTCENIKPACIFKPDGRDIEKTFTIMGFGLTEKNEKSNWLLKAEVNEVPLEKCKKAYKNIEDIHEGQMCAHHPERDSCKGELKQIQVFLL